MRKLSKLLSLATLGVATAFAPNAQALQVTDLIIPESIEIYVGAGYNKLYPNTPADLKANSDYRQAAPSLQVGAALDFLDVPLVLFNFTAGLRGDITFANTLTSQQPQQVITSEPNSIFMAGFARASLLSFYVEQAVGAEFQDVIVINKGNVANTKDIGNSLVYETGVGYTAQQVYVGLYRRTADKSNEYNVDTTAYTLRLGIKF